MIKLITIADLFSLLNCLFGFFAIILIFLDEMLFSFYFILLAILTDGLDGIIARKINHGDLGDYLEAMGDMTSLGIAPAIFVFLNYFEIYSSNFYNSLLLIIAIIIFLLLCIVRLSSFHIIKNDNFFIGLPASISTIILIILAIFKIDFYFIILALIIIGILMISNLHFPKPGYKINLIATILIFFTILFGENFYGIFPVVLFIALLIYSIFGPFICKIRYD